MEGVKLPALLAPVVDVQELLFFFGQLGEVVTFGIGNMGMASHAGGV
jgi:hypothetical protein